MDKESNACPNPYYDLSKAERQAVRSTIKDDTTLLEQALKLGASPDTKTSSGIPILTFATYFGSFNVADRLIHTDGINLEATTSEADFRATALIVAAVNGRSDIAKALLEAGANPNTLNTKQCNARKLAELAKSKSVYLGASDTASQQEEDYQNIITMIDQSSK